MFGYVTIDKPELKIREFEEYRSFYCGLCRQLREDYGVSGQISVTYDLTFAAMLLTGLYELPVQKGTTRCAVHPVFRQPVRKSTATDYCADMNILLTYYKCMDDWKDEKKLVRRGYAGLISRGEQRAAERWPKKAERIRDLLLELDEAEKSGSTAPDLCAGIFGHIMEEIFVWREEDVWNESLSRMGFFLGKYIYLLDAYDDVEKDVKSGNYNVFAGRYKEEGFEQEVRELLVMMMSEACREFERMPVLRYSGILRNILYSGVWSRYRDLLKKNSPEGQKEKAARKGKVRE